MIVTQELRTVTNMGLRDIKYDIGPFITLIDGPSFAFQWQERPKLLLGQVQDADQIVVSRTDLIDEKEIEHILGILKVEPGSVLLLDGNDSEPARQLTQQIVSMDDPSATQV